MSGTDAVLIYRNRLLPYSETFILAQGEGLREFRAHYVGLRRVEGLETPRDRTFVVNEGGAAGRAAEVGFSVFGTAPRFVRRLRAVRPRLFHAHFGSNAVRALPLVERLGVPLVVTFHGSDATRYDRYARGSLIRRWQYVRGRKRLQTRATCVIAVSDFIRDQLIRRGFPPERVVVHYTGIDTERFRLERPVRREPVVLFVGRLVEKKGCRYLIRAMETIQKERPACELVILGDGPLRRELEAQASSRLRRYRFLGARPPGEVRRWLARSRVLSVPSITAASGDAEGFGMVFAEAQAMGLPVASFASGGVPEAVADGETGLLAPERDWRALARNIALLLDDDGLWERLSHAGVRRVRELFDLHRQTPRLESLYRTFLGSDVSDVTVP